MTVETNELYAQIREALEKAIKASDACYEEAYRTRIVTKQSKTAREFIARYEELRDLEEQASWIK